MRHILLYICIASLLPQTAAAQMKHTFRIQNGKLVDGALPDAQATEPQAAGEPASQLVIDQKQQTLFRAQENMMKGDYQAAEHIYSQIISSDGGNMEAYLQRGVARREMKDLRGSQADARTVIELANRAIQRDPKDPHLFYKRSLALRLLKQFDLAKKDVITALDLGGKSSLRNDLQAIELEEKMAASQVVSAGK